MLKFRKIFWGGVIIFTKKKTVTPGIVRGAWKNVLVFVRLLPVFQRKLFWIGGRKFRDSEYDVHSALFFGLSIISVK